MRTIRERPLLAQLKKRSGLGAQVRQTKKTQRDQKAHIRSS